MASCFVSRRLFRAVVFGCIVLLFAAFTIFTPPAPSITFASPLGMTPTPMPGSTPALRGIHLGNHLGADWNTGLLSRIDPDLGGIYPNLIVVLSFQVYDRPRDANCRLQNVSIPDSRATIRTYLQHASSAGIPIVIRIMPSPGNFGTGHHLSAASNPVDGNRCNDGQPGGNRSYDDVGEEIVKIHEWNASHGIFELGFEPANEPNVEWYDNKPGDVASYSSTAWTEMDTYFSAVYDYVHARYPSPLIRVFTPPMSQGRFAEEYNVVACEPMGLVGYDYMPNVFLNGTKNDGVSWHNYWNEGKETWGDCNSTPSSPYGHHVAYQFPPQMLANINMPSKINIITEADVASSPWQNSNTNPLKDKDIDLGVRASNSLVRFINGEIIARYAAVWTLNVNQPVAEQPEQNWHEAYCDDASAPTGVRERPWFTRWWMDLEGSPARCNHTFAPIILKPAPTPTVCLGC